MKTANPNVAVAALIFLLFCFLSAPGSVFAGNGKQIRVNVGFKTSIKKQQVKNLISSNAAKKILALKRINVETYSIPAKNLSRFSKNLLATGAVSFVEEDTISSIPESEIPVVTSSTPNDDYYDQQWGPAAIGAEEAWELPFLLGDGSVIVAVIDTGVDYNHPDLVNVTDASIGYDFVNNDNDAMDDHGHGTHCSGIIAAERNNDIGIAGLQNVTIMPVKGLNANGSGYNSVLANCVTWAVEHGADVISMSWGGYSNSTTLSNALLNAVQSGVVCIAAAGNDNTDTAHYPSAYPTVIGVAALGSATSRASYSNYGKANVLISAPGSSILSTVWNDSYATMSGTSMACPHVAGVAAALIGLKPSLTPIQVAIILLGTADDLGNAGRDDYYGFGRVDMSPWLN